MFSNTQCFHPAATCPWLEDAHSTGGVTTALSWPLTRPCTHACHCLGSTPLWEHLACLFLIHFLSTVIQLSVLMKTESSHYSCLDSQHLAHFYTQSWLLKIISAEMHFTVFHLPKSCCVIVHSVITIKHLPPWYFYPISVSLLCCKNWIKLP